MKTKLTRISKRSLSTVLAILMIFSTLMVGTITANAWDANAKGHIYFAMPYTWTSNNSSVQYCIVKNDLTRVQPKVTLNKISNTDLYYGNGTFSSNSYGDQYDYAEIIANGNGWGDFDNYNNSSLSHYTTPISYKCNNTSYYYRFYYSDTGDKGIGVTTGNSNTRATALNIKQYVYAYTDLTRGGTYSNNETGGKVVVTYRTLSADNTSQSNTFDTSSESGSDYYTVPAELTLVATPNTGYEFVGWYTAASGGSALSTDSSAGRTVDTTTLNYHAVTSDYAIYARFRAKQYSITYKDGGNTAFSGTHASGYPTTHTYGTATTLKSASKTGYTFGGWYTNSGCTGSAVTSLGATSYTNNITLYAKWTANDYDVTLNTNGGTINSGNVTSYTYGVGATLPSDITKTGHTFGGWYDNSSLTGSAVTSIGTTATGDKEYWAKWTANTYNISYTGDNISYTSNPDTGTYGSTVSFNVAGTGDYVVGEVTGTYVDSNSQTQQLAISGSNGSYSFTMPAGAVTITTTAVRAPKTVSVTMGANINSYVVNGTTYTGAHNFTVSSGDSFTITSVSYATGYESNNNTLSIASVTADTSISLNAKQTVYTITQNAATNGSYTISKSSNVHYQDEITITPSPNTGYSVATVKYNDGSDHIITNNSGYKFTMPASNVSVTVTFSEDMHTVTATSSNATMGSAGPASASVGVDTSQTFTASANTGYYFVKWTVTSGSVYVGGTKYNTNAEISGSSITVTATEDAALRADFAAYSHNVICSGVHATVSSNKASASTGEAFIITASPDTGYSGLSLTVTLHGDTLSPTSTSGNTYTFTVPAYDNSDTINVVASVTAITPLMRINYWKSDSDSSGVADASTSGQTSDRKAETFNFYNGHLYPANTVFRVYDGDTLIHTGNTATTATNYWDEQLAAGVHTLRVELTLDGTTLTSSSITFTVNQSRTVAVQSPNYSGNGKVKLTYTNDYGTANSTITADVNSTAYAYVKDNTNATVSAASGTGTISTVYVNDNAISGTSLTVNADCTVTADFKSGVTLRGTLPGTTWDDGTSLKMVYTGTQYWVVGYITITQTGNYQFKFHDGTNWYGYGTSSDGGSVITDQTSGVTFGKGDSYKNAGFKATTTGVYTFKFNTNNYKVIIEIPKNEHNITYSGDHWSDSSKPSSALYTDTVTITPTTAEGYGIASVVVVDGSSNAVTVTKSGSSYSFEMPDSDVTVTVNSYRLVTLSLSKDANVTAVSAAVTQPDGGTANYTTSDFPLTLYYGSGITLTVTYANGYEYNSHNGATKSSDTSFTIASINANTTFEITSKKKNYTITVNASDSKGYVWITSDAAGENVISGTKNSTTTTTYSTAQIGDEFYIWTKAKTNYAYSSSSKTGNDTNSTWNTATITNNNSTGSSEMVRKLTMGYGAGVTVTIEYAQIRQITNTLSNDHITTVVTYTSMGGTANQNLAEGNSVYARTSTKPVVKVTSDSGYKFNITVKQTISGTTSDVGSLSAVMTTTQSVTFPSFTGTAPVAVSLIATEDKSTTWNLHYGASDGDASWGTAHAFVKNEGESSGDVAYVTVTLAANSKYYFKIKDGNTWYGKTDGNITKSLKTDANALTFSTSGGNCKITTSAPGDYVFRIDFSTSSSPKIRVQYPQPNTVKINVYVDMHGNTPSNDAKVQVIRSLSDTTVRTNEDDPYEETFTQNTNGNTSIYCAEEFVVPDDGNDLVLMVTSNGKMPKFTIDYTTYILPLHNHVSGASCDIWLEAVNQSKVATGGVSATSKVADNYKRLYLRKPTGWTSWNTIYFHAWGSNGDWYSYDDSQNTAVTHGATTLTFIATASNYHYYYVDIPSDMTNFQVIGYDSNGNYHQKSGNGSLAGNNYFELSGNNAITSKGSVTVPEFTKYYSSYQFNIDDSAQSILPEYNGSSMTVANSTPAVATYNSETGEVTPVASGTTTLTFTVSSTVGDVTQTRSVTTEVTVSDPSQLQGINLMSYQSAKSTISIMDYDNNGTPVQPANINSVTTRLTGVKAGAVFTGAGIWTITNNKTLVIKYAKANTVSGYENIKFTAVVNHSPNNGNTVTAERFGFDHWATVSAPSTALSAYPKADSEITIGDPDLDNAYIVYAKYNYTDVTINYTYYKYNTQNQGDGKDYNFYNTSAVETQGAEGFSNWHTTATYSVTSEYRGTVLRDANYSNLSSAANIILTDLVNGNIRDISNEYYNYSINETTPYDVTDYSKVKTTYDLTLKVVLVQTPRTYSVFVTNGSATPAKIDTVDGTNPIYYQSYLELTYDMLNTNHVAGGLSSAANAEYQWSISEKPVSTASYQPVAVGSTYRFRVTTDNMYIKAENASGSLDAPKSIITYAGKNIDHEEKNNEIVQYLYQNFYIVDLFNGDMATYPVTINGQEERRTYDDITFVGGGALYFSVDPDTGVPLHENIVPQELVTYNSTSGEYELNEQKVAEVLISEIKGNATDQDDIQKNFGTALNERAYKIGTNSTGLVYRYLPFNTYTGDDASGKAVYQKNTNVYRYSSAIGGYQYIYSSKRTNKVDNRNKDMRVYSYYIYSYVDYSSNDSGDVKYFVTISDNSVTAPTYVDPAVTN